MISTTGNRYLTEEQTARYINMSRSFLRHHRLYGFLEGRVQGPRYIRVGRAIRYKIEDLDEWMNSHACGPRF